MDTKKIMATFAILMIALGIAGYAYAHWNATITINGTITTGTFLLTPSFEATVHDAKGICKVTSSIQGDTLTVAIDKAYPCINVTGKFDLKNDGTVPAGLYKWLISVPGAGSWKIFDATDIKHSVINASMSEAEVEAALKSFVESAATGPAGTAVRISIDFDGSNFWQIDPGQNPTVTFNLHFEEALLQGYTFTFSMTLEYWNWNEVGYLH